MVLESTRLHARVERVERLLHFEGSRLTRGFDPAEQRALFAAPAAP